MRIPHAIYAGVFAGALIGAPAAMADPARDNLVRAETQIAALNPADATAASPDHYQSAQLRLGEARKVAPSLFVVAKHVVARTGR
jgi:hypothetical protein